MRRMLMSVFAVFLAGSAGAQSLQYLSTDGAVFDYEKNKHGAVLTSMEPLSEPLIVDGGDGVRIQPGDILYIGRACDAFSKEYGNGNWSWTNGGFIIEFPDIRVAFPGQAIDLAPGNRCRI